MTADPADADPTNADPTDRAPIDRAPIDRDPTDFDLAEVERRRGPLQENLDAVRARIDAAGGSQVALLPISKGHPVEAAIAAQQLGLAELGENKAQELLAKANVMLGSPPAMNWHFVGQIQSNKVRPVAAHVHTWQSVDRLKIGREIAKRSPGARVFAQVNLSAEPQKGGCAFDQLDELIHGMQQLELDVAGLMGVGTEDDELATAQGFARLRAAADRLALHECSMGMTADLEVAVREGSTMVRVGSALFGPRP